MIRQALIFVFLFLAQFRALARDINEVLTGTIGSYPIAMHISSYEGSCDGSRYYYLKAKKDIVLEGTLKDGNNIHLERQDWNDKLSKQVVAETFELHRVDNGWEGSWSSAGKQLPVKLRAADLSEFVGRYEGYSFIKTLKETEPFDYMRFKDIVLVKEREYEEASRTLCTYKEPLSGISLVRLVSGYSSRVMDAVNDSLTNIQLADVAGSLGCSSPAGSEYTSEVHELFLTDHVISFSLFGSYSCGGAHPDFGQRGYTYDAQTGEQLSLEDIFWPGGSKPPADADSEDTSGYHTQVFAPAVVELFKKIYPKEMTPPVKEDEEQCNYSDPYIWHYPPWFLTKKGLYLGAVFARYARNCDSPDWAFIPYEELQKYRNPERKDLVLP